MAGLGSWDLGAGLAGITMLEKLTRIIRCSRITNYVWLRQNSHIVRCSSTKAVHIPPHPCHVHSVHHSYSQGSSGNGMRMSGITGIHFGCFVNFAILVPRLESQLLIGGDTGDEWKRAVKYNYFKVLLCTGIHYFLLATAVGNG